MDSSSAARANNCELGEVFGGYMHNNNNNNNMHMHMHMHMLHVHVRWAVDESRLVISCQFTVALVERDGRSSSTRP